VRVCGSRRVVLYLGGVLSVVIVIRLGIGGVSGVVRGCLKRCVENRL
jgi:hypothetical protein